MLVGTIADPRVVIGINDAGLLLLIIVEVSQTVIDYTQASETRWIVRLVVSTGVIAMVRKAIIFGTGESASTQDALFPPSVHHHHRWLVGLSFVERTTGPAA